MSMTLLIYKGYVWVTGGTINGSKGTSNMKYNKGGIPLMREVESQRVSCQIYARCVE